MEASPFIAVRISWAEGYPYTFLHYHCHSGETVQWCVGVLRNGERQQQCSTKPFGYRVPPKEIQGSGHSSGSDQPEATNGSHCNFWSVICGGQPIGGDQDHGHSTEVWEVGWSNPGQDCSMDHGRVGHSCAGLIRQGCSHPVSHGYSVRGLSLQEACHYLLCPSVGVNRYSLEDSILVEPDGKPAVIVTDRPGDMEF